MGTHPACHPQRLMLAFKKIIIQNQKKKPNTKKFKKIKIHPPQLLQNKWFFQKNLSDLNLFQLYIATCDLNKPNYNQQKNNNSIKFSVLNTNIFTNIN